MYLKLLKSHIKEDILFLHLPDGSVHKFGERGMEAHWYIRSESAIRRIARNWDFELGETYMEGGWDVGEHSLHDLLAVLRKNFSTGNNRHWYMPFLRLYRRVNHIARSYRNIAHHYDVDEEVFRRILDTQMYYSCAYFRQQDESLEQA
ncbi:MAG: class I SAM-dependent methyltransferase, partial [Pseudohongiellaceae bacterium]